MFFPQQEEQTKLSQWRSVFIYVHDEKEHKPFELKLGKKKITIKQIAKSLKMHSLRLFNSQGVQYFQDDLQYLKHKSILYASNGQDFDANICFLQYQMSQLLGEGGFGKVYLAEHKFTKQKYAIKIIKTQNIGSAADIDSIFIQSQILKSLKHENIVKVHNCLTLKNMQVAIIMQFLQGGDLLKYVTKQKRVDEKVAKIFLEQIMKGIFYCHQNNLIHRDLKLENILLVNSQELKIKIIDFGIAGIIHYLTWEDLDTGSLAYMAPQCFTNSKNYKVDGKIDIWAIGVILYCMIVGQQPFKGSTNFQKIQSIKHSQYKIPAQIVKAVSKQCIHVIRRCLQSNPKTRITIQQLMNHPWFSSNKIFTQKLQEDTIKQFLIEFKQPFEEQPLKEIINEPIIIKQKRVDVKKPKFKYSESKTPELKGVKKATLKCRKNSKTLIL